MRVGLIGSGNLARALARGWGEPVLCTDGGSGRAQALAAEVGGEAVADNVTLAERSDLVVLCHKPYQLDAVAREIAGRTPAVASVLAGVTTDTLRDAFPATETFRFMPNTPVEVRRGVIAYVARADADRALEAAVLERFGRLGEVVSVDEALIDVAMAINVGPAYVALIVEAWVDAAVRRGLPAELASRLCVETIAGSAELLRARGGDTLAVRREVTSPRGVTARGLDALEQGGLRAALSDALDAVVDPPR